jgi:hypothetical protein
MKYKVEVGITAVKTYVIDEHVSTHTTIEYIAANYDQLEKTFNPSCEREDCTLLSIILIDENGKPARI